MFIISKGFLDPFLEMLLHKLLGYFILKISRMT